METGWCGTGETELDPTQGTSRYWTSHSDRHYSGNKLVFGKSYLDPTLRTCWCWISQSWTRPLEHVCVRQVIAGPYPGNMLVVGKSKLTRPWEHVGVGKVKAGPNIGNMLVLGKSKLDPTLGTCWSWTSHSWTRT